MSTLTIQGPGQPGRDPEKVSLAASEAGTFGICECGNCHLDLLLTAVRPVNFRGQVIAGADRWHVENLSDSEPLVVRDVDRRVAAAVALPTESLPFTHDMAVITPFSQVSGAMVTVFFNPSGERAVVGSSCPGISAPPELMLDPNARYFAVLSVLCEHVVRGGPVGLVPTSARIAARLALSPRAVDSHIDYLIGKFDIPAPVTRSNGWKRQALIRYVQAHEGIVHVLRRSGRGRMAVA